MMNTEYEDTLIGGVAANEAGDEAWATFERHAAAEPRAWERLARTLRDELQIRTALDDALEGAESIEVPPTALGGNRRFTGRVSGWPGWALAAMIALAWVGTSVFAPLTEPDGRPTFAGEGGALRHASLNNSDEAYRDYISLGTEEGRVIQELPNIMIELRSLDDGTGVEVFYVRQSLERARIDSALQLQRDELGRHTAVPIKLASLREGPSL